MYGDFFLKLAFSWENLTMSYPLLQKWTEQAVCVLIYFTYLPILINFLIRSVGTSYLLASSVIKVLAEFFNRLIPNFRVFLQAYTVWKVHNKDYQRCNLQFLARMGFMRSEFYEFCF